VHTRVNLSYRQSSFRASKAPRPSQWVNGEWQRIGSKSLRVSKLVFRQTLQIASTVDMGDQVCN